MAIRNNNNALCSPRRAETFPHGLRVLVVDADLTWLKIIAKMLKKCFYEVTTCCLAREALNILCERKDGFDIVISDVNMPDMDGFKLLEYVGLEMDLPVIMMSVDGETSRVMKGIQHGACDYLLKPIRMKELRNIWQHVVRKKINEVNDIEGLKGIEKLEVMRSGISDQSDDGFFFSGDDQNLVKKRKGFEYKHNDKEFADDPSLVKKTRVVWNVELHKKFVKAVNHIGNDKIGPKKILDLMNIPWLTRENVASHLQKYRLYLSRLQEECDLKVSFSGIEHSKLPPKEPAGNAIIENDNPKNYESEIGSIHSLLMLESERAISGDICEIQKATSSSGTDLIRSFESVDANHSTLSSIIPPQCSWNRNVPGGQIRQEHSPNFDIKNDLNDLNHVVFPSLHNQIYFNNLPATHSMYTTPFKTEINNIPCIETNAPTECSNQHITRQTPGVAIGHCPILSNSYITTCFPSEKITRSTWSTKNQAMDQILANDLSYVSHLPYLESQYKECSEDFSNCSNSELLTDVPPFFYDETKLKYESHSESHRNIL